MPEIKLTNTKFIRIFVDRLLKDKGVPEAEWPTLRDSLVQEVEEKIETAMLGTLSVEQLEQLNRLLDEGADDAELEKFFAGVEGDYTQSIERALAEYRNNFLQKKEA